LAKSTDPIAMTSISKFARLRCVLLVLLVVATGGVHARANEAADQVEVASRMPVAADEPSARRVVSGATYSLLEQRDFAGVERLATRLRDPAQRTPSGVWKLTLFYATTAKFLSALSPCAGDGAAAAAYFAQWKRAMPASRTWPLAHAHYALCAAKATRSRAARDPASEAALAKAIDAVRAELESQGPAVRSDGYWYELMLMVEPYRKDDPARLQALLAELAKQRPAFYQAWFEAHDVAALRYDAVERIEALAREAMRAGGKDEGEALYARIYWWSNQVYFGDALFRTSRADWKTMSRGFDAMLARYPDAWNLNHYARFACLAGDRAKTEELMKRIGAQPLPSAWKGQADFTGCRDGTGGGFARH
jgi:hypothetical protein